MSVVNNILRRRRTITRKIRRTRTAAVAFDIEPVFSRGVHWFKIDNISSVPIKSNTRPVARNVRRDYDD